MANKDAAFGLRAIGKIGQNRDNQGLAEYSITANDTTTIYFQDAVSATAAGTIHQAAASEAYLVGSLNGVFYTDPNTSKPTWSNYYPGSTNAIEVTAGDSANYVSKSELNDSTVTTGTAQLKVVGVSKDIDNNDLGTSNVNFVVMINEHLYNAKNTGI
jgi:hypothetical protein